MTSDISGGSIDMALPGRPWRLYPVVVSTEADAMGWARGGAVEGSVVVAEHQVSARARPRRPWPPAGEHALSFTLILRPDIPPARGGILHLAATLGIADVLGPEAEIEWPDEIYVGTVRLALVSVHLEQTVRGLEWALVNAMLTTVPIPRPQVLARTLEAIERRYRQPAAELVAEWTPRCRTLGDDVTALLYPIGREQAVSGRAVSVSATGALTIDTTTGARVVRPHQLASWSE